MKLTVNGRDYELNDLPEGEVLLWALRDGLGFTGVKFGCGAGICGSCTVHVDGVATRACITPVAAIAGRKITTIEGLAPSEDTLHPVQQAFLETQTPQCGWCMPGQMMTAAAFLSQNPNPTQNEIRTAMNNNYCRCGTYDRIRKAVALAAQIQRGEV